MDKRLIEVCFPIKEVSAESVREKNIRHGHISTLHIWWARRPLAACRAAIFASLVKDPGDEKKRQELTKFIVKLCRWENSLNKQIIEKARKLIRENYPNAPPKLLDCFAGGGSIPLEALRLGCETYALEYNPVAVLILKATLEYPQKYGKAKRKSNKTLTGEEEYNPLIEDVKKWGEWILEEVKKEIGRFYPPDPEGNIPIGYIWARTIKCPSCGAEIPLIKQFWLAKKENRKIAYKPIINKEKKEINFEIVEGDKIDFNPSEGFVKKANAKCPICGTTIDDNTIRKLFRHKMSGERMIAVVLHHPKKRKKFYRICNKRDVEIFQQAQKYLEIKIKELKEKWGFDPLPVESLPPKETLGFRVQRYGIEKWCDLFNFRQKLSLISFVEGIRKALKEMMNAYKQKEYVQVLGSYIALCFSKLTTTSNTLTRWNNASESVAGKPDQFGTLEMKWDYIEINPFSGFGGSFQNHLNSILNVKVNRIPNLAIMEIIQGSAIKLPYENEYFDIIITDPPYYDNIPYADLSDFFYVWLKRVLSDILPDIFSTPLTPKSEEIIADPSKHGGSEKAKVFFERMLRHSFQEMNRVLKSEGIAGIVFAHKSTEAWEAIISALLNSGFTLSASWPVHTERKGRQRAQESAALASSIFMICRKRRSNEEVYFKNVAKQLRERIHERLEYFWKQGIGGADFFISAIGPAVEVFGRYAKVKKLTGEAMSVKELLNYVRTEVIEYVLRKILKGAELGLIDPLTRFYITWRWTYGNKRVFFDEARKLAQASGIEITDLWNNGLVKKEKEWISVLGPKERKDLKGIWKKAEKQKLPIVDALHYACILWEENKRKELEEFLSQTGYLQSEAFWVAAQALSEILEESKEKKLIQGLLLSKRDLKFRKQPSIMDYVKGE
ncbi:DUF1156 domain-containing protein [Candidatus Bathyarchaeota archaeon]|nr:DUF1156 domain-containing protein [Candidatus Bathyarchaeota archaeon]